VARRAAAFGMDVVHHSRRPVDVDGSRPLPLDELLSTSDVVSLHCPLTPQTRHLIDADALRAMKRGAYLINTARGPIVDEAALAGALADGTIAGAGLDVYENEPEVHDDLRRLDNVVLAPHLGSATVETRTRMAELAVDNVVAVLTGKDAPTPISVPSS
jgi:glyoxylate reductase